MTASPSKGAVFEPGAKTFSPTPDFEHIVTLFDPETLLRTVSTLAGSHAHRPLKLDRANFDARPEARLSRSLVKLLVEELDAQDFNPFADGGCGTRTGDPGGVSLRLQPQLQRRSRWSAARRGAVANSAS